MLPRYDVYYELEELHAIRKRGSAERSRILGAMAKSACAWLKRQASRAFAGGFHAAH